MAYDISSADDIGQQITTFHNRMIENVVPIILQNPNIDSSNTKLYLNDDLTQESWVLNFSIQGGVNFDIARAGPIVEKPKLILISVVLLRDTLADENNLFNIFESKQNQTLVIEMLSHSDSEENKHKEFLKICLEKFFGVIKQNITKGPTVVVLTFACNSLKFIRTLEQGGKQEVNAKSAENPDNEEDQKYNEPPEEE